MAESSQAAMTQLINRAKRSCPRTWRRVEFYRNSISNLSKRNSNESPSKEQLSSVSNNGRDPSKVLANDPNAFLREQIQKEMEIAQFLLRKIACNQGKLFNTSIAPSTESRTQTIDEVDPEIIDMAISNQALSASLDEKEHQIRKKYTEIQSERSRIRGLLNKHTVATGDPTMPTLPMSTRDPINQFQAMRVKRERALFTESMDLKSQIQELETRVSDLKMQLERQSQFYLSLLRKVQSQKPPGSGSVWM